MKYFYNLLATIFVCSATAIVCSCTKVTPQKTFSISFHTNGGTAIPDLVMASGQEIKKPADPLKNDSTLEGWYTDQELTRPFGFGVIYYTTKGFDLYARWTKAHTINFNTNGAPPIANVVVNAGKVVPKPLNPQKDGYTFVGWYTDATFSTPYDFTQPVHRNFTLYAKFEQGKLYNVYFVVNGGTSVQTQIIKSGSFVKKPAIANSGKTLVGWYADAAYQSPFDFVNTPVTAEISLYAKWAVSNPESDFTFDVATATITAYTGTSMDVVVPETIQGKTVTALAYGLFMNKLITSITLPSTITSFATRTEFGFETVSRTFQGCTNLTNINLFNTAIVTLPKWTFMFANVGVITLPGTLTQIQQGAFESSMLTILSIPNSLDRIEQYAFFRCKNLAQVTLGKSLTFIGNGAFAESSMLNSVTVTRDILPVTTIDNNDSPFRSVSPSLSIRVPNVVFNDYKTNWAIVSGSISGY